MPRLLVRLFAIVMILGQLAQVAGGAFCALPTRGQKVHCDEGMTQPAGASVSAPMDGMAPGLCSLMGPCGAPVPAVAIVPVAGDLALLDSHLAAAPVANRFESFDPAPIPPPPQG